MASESDYRIVDVRTYPLVQRLPQPAKTSWGTYEAVSILLVEVETASGICGVGECLARFAPAGYAEVIKTATPRLIGQDATAITARWKDMRRTLSGRSGGILIEAMSAVDIALWDILGKAANLPIWKLLGGVGKTDVPVYGASIRWGTDSEADSDLDLMRERGLSDMKVKIGRPVDEACRRIARLRERAGDDIRLSADSNWAYSLDEAERVAAALADNGYHWFEEPLRPEDEDGYRQLRRRCAVPLAAGESNYTLDQAMPLIRDRTLSVLQPNVTRSGGITETRRMAELAAMHDISYAPHVGMSGIICEVASLHLAAAMPNTLSMECAFAPNRFRDGIADIAPANKRIKDGTVAAPDGPGLGITMDWDVVKEMVA